MTSATLLHMEIETRGELIRRRMDSLGLNKAQLSEASALARRTLDKALADDPTTRDTTYTVLTRVLDEIEADRAPGPDRYVPSMDAEPFRIEMSGVYGVERVVFSGPPADADAIRRAAAEFVREIQSGAKAD